VKWRAIQIAVVVVVAALVLTMGLGAMLSMA
jgi:uncharacterized membrane protein